jgi:hypothetical protein
LSVALERIDVQTGVHGFDFRTSHTPINSRISEANIWSNSYDHLTSVGGQRGGCQQLLLRKGDDEDKKGGKAERVYGCNIGT